MPEADIKSALARVRAARALDPDTPAALPSVSVGPSEYSEHMAVAGPLAEAKDDLDGLPAIPESGTSGYVIRGRVVSNSEVKRYIIEQIAAGLPLPVIVDAAKSARFPSLFTVRKWLRQDDKFAEAYKMAREIRGERLGEKALQVALDATEENVKVAKLQHEALSKHAARLNRDYQDKQVIEQQVDPITVMPMADAISRLKALMSIPEVARQVSMPGLPATLDGELAPGSRLQIVKAWEDPLDAATPLVEEGEPDINHVTYDREEDADELDPS